MQDKNYKLTVVIPTIWSCDLIYESVSRLQQMDIIGEIIIINNRPDLCKKKISGDKIVEYEFDNIFVNAAWNFGVKNATYNKVCLLNDDVIVDDFGFVYALFMLDNPQIGILGASKSCFKNFNDDYSIEFMPIRNRGYGTCLFFRKQSYVPIPDDLKIWFGDDWMIKTNEGRTFRFKGPHIKTEMSSSSNSPEFKNVIDQDVQNSIKYNLPWSNDYED